MAKEKLTDNEAFMEIMADAASDDYTAAAHRIAELEAQDDPAQAEPQTEAARQAAENRARGDGVILDYDLNGDEVYAALDAFQKKRLYRKNIVYSVLLGLIVLWHGVEIVFHPNESYFYIVAFGCAVILFFIWNLPYRHKKATALAADAVDDPYHAEVYGDRMFTGAGAQTEVVPFDEKSFVLEDKLGFIVSPDKTRVFMLPNRCMDPPTQARLRELLRDYIV